MFDEFLYVHNDIKYYYKLSMNQNIEHPHIRMNFLPARHTKRATREH